MVSLNMLSQDGERSSVSMPDPIPTFLLSPFTVLVDTREQLPYSFCGFFTDRKDGGLPLVVSTRTVGLQSGDYSVDGYADQVSVERKSLADLYSTFGKGRARFEHELARLDMMPFANVVVESSLGQAVANPPLRTRLKPKTIMRSVIAWRYRYQRIHWHFVDDRRLAEILTYRLLERFYVGIVCGGKNPRTGLAKKKRPASERISQVAESTEGSAD